MSADGKLEVHQSSPSEDIIKISLGYHYTALATYVYFEILHNKEMFKLINSTKGWKQL